METLSIILSRGLRPFFACISVLMWIFKVVFIADCGRFLVCGEVIVQVDYAADTSELHGARPSTQLRCCRGPTRRPCQRMRFCVVGSRQ